MKRSSNDETLLDTLFQSLVFMISHPNSTLNSTRDLLSTQEVTTYPQRAINDTTLWAKIVGDIPRSFPSSSILDMPRHEKTNKNSTSICSSVWFSHAQEEF